MGPNQAKLPSKGEDLQRRLLDLAIMFVKNGVQKRHRAISYFLDRRARASAVIEERILSSQDRDPVSGFYSTCYISSTDRFSKCK